MSDNIKVAIRIRPLLGANRDDPVLWRSEASQVLYTDRGESVKPFQFDEVFDQDATTDDVNEAVARPVIEGAMQGFNGSIFAYGQTASGKTFTMMGTEDCPGIIPRAITNIFNWIEVRAPEREFLIRVSYLEIYNENVSDLLGDPKKHLDVREDTTGNVFVNNLKEELVTGPAGIFKLMKQGEDKRRYGSTNMNERSSRSHTIFRVIIESRERQQEQSSSDGAINVSHLNLVDLAGSEKASQTGSTGSRFQEGCYINKSLLTLGQVIQRLSENSSYVNYRDSRLTRILQNALGGNSKTTIIANVTPSSFDETLSTLRFATSAKKIKNKAIVNEVLTDQAMLRKYKHRISKLEKELGKVKDGELEKENMELGQMLAEKERIRLEQEEKIRKLKEFICVSSSTEVESQAANFKDRKKRRETWAPGNGRPFQALKTSVGRSNLPALPVLSELTPEPNTRAKRRGQSDIGTPSKALGRSVKWASPAETAAGSLADELALASGKDEDADNSMPDLNQTEWTMDLSNLNNPFTENAKLDASCQTTQELGTDSEQNEEQISELKGELSKQAEAFAKIQDELHISHEQNSELKKQIEVFEKAAATVSTTEAKTAETMEDGATKPEDGGKPDDTSNSSHVEKLISEIEQLKAENCELKEHIDVLVVAAINVNNKDETKEEQNKQEEMNALVQRLQSENEELSEHIRVLVKSSSLEKMTETKEERQDKEDGKVLKELRAQIESIQAKKNQQQSGAQEALQLTEELLSRVNAECESNEILQQKIAKLTEDYNAECASNQKLEERLAQLQQEYNELEFFTRNEKEFQNESILAKQLHRVSMGGLDTTAAFSEALMFPSPKESKIRSTRDTAELLEQVKHLREELEGEKSSRAELVEQEQAKFSLREADLKEQVETANQEIAALMEQLDAMEKCAAAPETPSFQKSTPTQDRDVTVLEERVAELEMQLQILTTKLEEAEELLMNNESAEKTNEADMAINEETSSSQLESSQQSLVEEESAQKSADSEEKQADQVFNMEDKIAELEAQLKSIHLVDTSTPTVRQSGDAALKERIEELETQLACTAEKLAVAQELLQPVETNTEEQVDAAAAALQERITELESQLECTSQRLTAAEELLQIDEAPKIPAFDADTEQINITEQDALKMTCNNLTQQVATLTQQIIELEAVNKRTSSVSDSDGVVAPISTLKELQQELKKQRTAHAALNVKYEELNSKYLSEYNKDLSQQKQLGVQDKRQKEAYAAFSKLQQEDKEEINKLNKQLYEANCQIQKIRVEAELGGHKLKKAEEEVQKLQSEIRNMVDVQARHAQQQQGQHNTGDPEKLKDQLKKLRCALDLTQQRLAKFEMENKDLKTLAKKNEDAAFERNSLQSQLRDLNHQLEKKSSEVVKFQQRCSSMQGNNANLGLDLATTQDKLEKVTQENACLQKTITAASSRRDEQLSGKDELEKQLTALKKENIEIRCQLETSTDDIQAQLTKTQSENSQLLSGNDDLKRAVECLEAEKLKLVSEIEQMRSDHKEMAAQLKSLLSEKEDIEQQLKQRLSTEREAEKSEQLETEEKLKLEAEIEEMRSDHKEMAAQLKSLFTEKEDIEQQLERLTSEKSELLEREEEYKEKLQGLEGEREELLNRLLAEKGDKKKHEDNTPSDEVKSSLLAHNQQLENTVQELEQKKKQLEQRFEALEAAKDHIQTRLKTIQDEKEEQEEMLNQVIADKEDIDSQLEVLQEENKSLKEKLSLLESNIGDSAQLHDKYKALLAEKEEQEEMLTKIITDNEDLESQLESLKSEKESSESNIPSIQSLQDKLKSTQAEKADQEDMLKQLITLKEELQSQLEKLKTEKETLVDKISQLESHISEVETQQKHLENLHTEKEELHNQSLADKEELESNLQSLQTEKEALEQKLCEMESNVQSKLQSLKAEKEALEQKLWEMEATVTSMQQRLQDNNNASETERSKQEEIMNQMVEDMAELQTQLEVVQSENKALKKTHRETDPSSSPPPSPAELQQLQGSLNQLLADKEELSSQLEESQMEKEHLHDLLQELRDDKQLLQTRIEALEKNASAGEEQSNRVEELLAEKEEIEVKLLGLHAYKDELEEELAALKEANLSLQIELDDLKEEAEEEKKQNAASDATEGGRLAELQAEILSLQEQLTEAKQQQQQQHTGDDADDWRRKAEELEQELEILQVKHAKNASDLENERQTVEYLEKNDAHLKKCCDEADAELEAEQQKVETLTTELQTLQESYETLQKEYKQKIQAATPESDGAWEEKTKTLQEELNDLQEKYDRDEAFLKKCCDEADAELEAEQQKVETLTTELQTLQESYETLQKLHEQAQKSSNGQSTRHSQASYDAMVKELATLKQSSAQMESTNAALRKQLDEMAACQREIKEVAKIKKELREALYRLSILQEDNEKLNEEVVAQKKELHNHFFTNGELRKEIRRLKNEQLDESLFQSKPSTCPTCKSAAAAAAGPGQKMLEQQISIHQKEVEDLKAKVTHMERTLSTKQYVEADLRHKILKKERQLGEKETEVKQFRFYYNRELNKEEKDTVRGMIAAPPKGASIHASTQTEEPQKASRKKSDDELSWLVRAQERSVQGVDSDEEDKPQECKTQ